VTITINSIQDAPVANDDTSPFILEDFQANIGVLLNDFDPDGDAFSIFRRNSGDVGCRSICRNFRDVINGLNRRETSKWEILSLLLRRAHHGGYGLWALCVKSNKVLMD